MTEFLLPYRTDWPAMLEIIDYLKGSGVERSILDARFGGGETMRERLNALEQLAVIERADQGLIRLSERGHRIAYATTEAERQEALLEAIVDYRPYRMPLLRAQGDGLERIDGPWLERVWQVDMRLSQPRNRVEEARTFFLRLAESAGLGTFRRGVRGQPSRLELSSRFTDFLRMAIERLDAAKQSSGESADLPDSADEAPATRVDDDIMGSPRTAGRRVHAMSPAIDLHMHVDLSEWSLEKIAGLFDLLESKWPGGSAVSELRMSGDISHERDAGHGGGSASGE